MTSNNLKHVNITLNNFIKSSDIYKDFILNLEVCNNLLNAILSNSNDSIQMQNVSLIDFDNLFLDDKYNIVLDLDMIFNKKGYNLQSIFKSSHLIHPSLLNVNSGKEFIRKVTEEHLNYLFGLCTFNILFRLHAFHGKLYYNEPITNIKKDIYFYIQKHNFIFDDIDNNYDNPNGFINGYHENARLLWLELSDDQRMFFRNIFDNKIKTMDHLKDEWNKNFLLVRGYAKSKCGQKFDVALFSNGYSLIQTNKYCAKNVNCYKIVDGMNDKCTNCKYEKVVNPYIVKGLLKYENMDAKDIFFIAGSIINSNYLFNENALNPIKYFEVIQSSKRDDLLGLKILVNFNIDVHSVKEGIKKTFEINQIISLLPGIKISIPDICTILVK